MNTNTTSTRELQVSKMAEALVGSEIIKLAGEIRQKIANGEHIHNFTIGDFNPEVFPIPDELKSAIVEAYQNNETNYPPSNGILELRQAVNGFVNRFGEFPYDDDAFLISGGARPLIYAAYQALVDADDSVVFPVPSWNNNHYTHLAHANPVFIETTAEDHFMPTAASIAPHIEKANLIAVCSPLNPTGTTFTAEKLSAICDLILAENQRRGPDQKPVYLIYDQIYWTLTHGVDHHHPVALRPEMKDFTIYIDGLSKAFAATGVRVGWAFGPQRIINKMKSILGHVGAWAPKAEQVASAHFLNNETATAEFLTQFKADIHERLAGFYDGFKQLRSDGFHVDAIAPQAAIYLTVQFDLLGKTTPEGNSLDRVEDITDYLLNAAGLAMVPFYAFGASRSSTWYRLSVGTAKMEALPEIFTNLRKALSDLH